MLHEKVLEDFSVLDLADVTALELADGKVTVSHKGGEQNEFTLHEGTAIEIGKQAVPVENLVELRLER